ncbi:MAG TPA: F0F1 ATP synthase subunit A [Acidimicrobiales bacterium]
MLALDVPPISHLVEWPDIALKGSALAINKVTILFVIGAVLVMGFYLLAGTRKQMVPTGIQGLAESAVSFVNDGIIMQTIGPDGMRFAPFLISMFSFIFCLNLFEVIPFVQMPPNARMALPLLLAVVVWIIYNVVGVSKQGFFGYLKGIAFPPGVPIFLYILVTPIELVSVLIVRPLSLSVRLFANLLAGHLILTTFAVMTSALFSSGFPGIVLAVLTFALLVALTGFELLVAFLQAYIFSILAAVYVGGAMHPEH